MYFMIGKAARAQHRRDELTAADGLYVADVQRKCESGLKSFQCFYDITPAPLLVVSVRTAVRAPAACPLPLPPSRSLPRSTCRGFNLRTIRLVQQSIGSALVQQSLSIGSRTARVCFRLGPQLGGLQPVRLPGV